MENEPESEKPVGILTPISDFLVALQFLTMMPPVLRRSFTRREMGRAIGYYPLVGLVLGGILYAAGLLLPRVFPQALSAALVLALWVILTGALHVDGFLDSTDGLLGGFTPESRLEIMGDEHKGAYAVAGGILLFLIKFTAIFSLVGTAGVRELVTAAVLGRWGMALALIAFPYARPQGLGRVIKENAGWQQAALATIFALGSAWLVSEWWGLAGAALALGVMLLCVHFTLRRIPGLTGDVYGMINELIELAVLVGLTVKI